ncbi:class I SAM-dependent methyltransferase [Halococcus saccharolyticus]|nr:class I SAM-dependent methyltransferase [Halococcus saccharolyticus]
MDESVADTVATYERVAPEYRERHADRSVIADAIETFLGALDGIDGDRVLDVGCGPGWESATFREHGLDVTAIDLSRSFLDATGEVASGASRARMDMRTLGVAERSVDGLWACASFLHVPHADASDTLREFRRVLRPNGVFFCAVARGEGERTRGGETYGERDERHFTLYTPEKLRERTIDAGFVVEELHEGSDGEWLHLLARAP